MSMNVNDRKLNINIMKKRLQLALVLITIISTQLIIAQEKTIAPKGDFDKIIVSPHIEVEFVQGTVSKIEVQEITVPIEKFNYEVSNNTLQVYLEGAKTLTKHKKYDHNGWKHKMPLYKNKVAKIKITYTDVNVFSLRGEEKITFESPLDQKECTLRIYGESEVLVKEAKLENLRVAIYGESHLVIDSGTVTNQKITAYGSSKVRTLNVDTKDAKVTAYGEGTYQLNVSDRLKVTSYGEANILYKGSPELKKGIVIGESTIASVSE